MKISFYLTIWGYLYLKGTGQYYVRISLILFFFLEDASKKVGYGNPIRLLKKIPDILTVILGYFGPESDVTTLSLLGDRSGRCLGTKTTLFVIIFTPPLLRNDEWHVGDADVRGAIFRSRFLCTYYVVVGVICCAWTANI